MSGPAPAIHILVNPVFSACANPLNALSFVGYILYLIFHSLSFLGFPREKGRVGDTAGSLRVVTEGLGASAGINTEIFNLKLVCT